MEQDKMFELEKLFRSVFRKMRQEINEILGEEVSSNEFIVLKILSASGPQKASVISRELNVSASHITAVTDSLVKKGYITRQRLENDRRVVEMVLTDLGLVLVHTAEKKKSAYLRSKFTHFSEQELAQFIQLFEKLNT